MAHLIYLELPNKQNFELVKSVLGNNLIKTDQEYVYSCSESVFLDSFDPNKCNFAISGLTRDISVGIKNTKALLNNLAQSFFFNIPTSELKLQASEQFPCIKFSQENNCYTVDRSELHKLPVRKFINKCIKYKHFVTPIDLNSSIVTEGSIALCDAFHCCDLNVSIILQASALKKLWQEYKHAQKYYGENFKDFISVDSVFTLNDNPLNIANFCSFEDLWNKSLKNDNYDYVCGLFDENAGGKIKRNAEFTLSKIDHNLTQNELIKRLAYCVVTYLRGLSLEVRAKYEKNERLDQWQFGNNSNFVDFQSQIADKANVNLWAAPDDNSCKKLLYLASASFEKILNSYFCASCIEDLRSLQKSATQELLNFCNKELGCDFSPHFNNNLQLQTGAATQKKILPYYIQITKAQRNSLSPELKKEICYDVANNEPYVARTESNLHNFAAFFPKKTKMNNESAPELSVSEIQNKIAQAGQLSNRALNNLKIDSTWHHDPDVHNNHMRYVVNLRCERPCAVIINSRSNEKFYVPFTENTKQLSTDLYIQTKFNEHCDKLNSLNKKIDNSLSLQNALRMMSLKPLTFATEYTSKKEIDPASLGAFYDPDGKFTKWFCPKLKVNNTKDLIYIPVYNPSGAVVSMQMIDAMGNKLFASNCPFKGNFAAIGGYKSLSNASKIIVCEGIATGASIKSVLHQEDLAVVCALASNNVKDVVSNLIYRFPKAFLGLCPDHDALTASRVVMHGSQESDEYLKNSGIASAVSTVIAFQHRKKIDICIPPLKEEDLKKKLSDFNDALKYDRFTTINSLNNFYKKLDLRQANEEEYQQHLRELQPVKKNQQVNIQEHQKRNSLWN